MGEYIVLPSRQEAEEMLSWAYTQNPGPWAEHSRAVARAAQTIAEQCALHPDRAYISGLLHDIGRYEGVRGLHHIYVGYDFLLAKGYGDIAEICLSHSFPYQNLGTYCGDFDCSPDEMSVIQSFLSKAVYNDYDKLIQLCDCLGTAKGVCLMEVRLVDVIRRHGFSDFTLKKWDSTFLLKDYFDKLCRMNIYDLFFDEIREVSFR